MREAQAVSVWTAVSLIEFPLCMWYWPTFLTQLRFEFGSLGKLPHQGVYAIHYLSVTPHRVSQMIMEMDYFTAALHQEYVSKRDDLHAD